MNAKQRANEMMNRYMTILNGACTEIVKNCALIAIDYTLTECLPSLEGYWQEVKEEVKNY